MLGKIKVLFGIGQDSGEPIEKAQQLSLLFEAPVPVSGYTTKRGTYVAPTTGKRRKKIQPPAHDAHPAKTAEAAKQGRSDNPFEAPQAAADPEKPSAAAEPKPPHLSDEAPLPEHLPDHLQPGRADPEQAVSQAYTFGADYEATPAQRREDNAAALKGIETRYGSQYSDKRTNPMLNLGKDLFGPEVVQEARNQLKAEAQVAADKAETVKDYIAAWLPTIDVDWSGIVKWDRDQVRRMAELGEKHGVLGKTLREVLQGLPLGVVENERSSSKYSGAVTLAGALRDLAHGKDLPEIDTLTAGIPGYSQAAYRYA